MAQWLVKELFPPLRKSVRNAEVTLWIVSKSVSNSQHFWPLTLNNILPRTMVCVSSSSFMGDISVIIVERESLKQFSTTPLLHQPGPNMALPTHGDTARDKLCVYAEEHFYVFMQKNTSMCLCRRTLLCVYAVEHFFVFMQRTLLHRCLCRRTLLCVYAEEHFYVFIQKNTSTHVFMQKNTSICLCRRTLLCVYAEEHCASKHHKSC